MTLELWAGKRISLKVKLKVGTPVKQNLYPELVGNSVIVSDRLTDEDLFTSYEIINFDVGIDSREQLTQEISNQGKEVSKNLDEEGIIRVGTEIKTGDILVGIKKYSYESEITTEERLLIAIFGEKAETEQDVSFCYPYRDPAVVLEAKKIYSVEQPMKIKIVVGVKKSLKIGDILEDREKNPYTVAQIGHLPRRADILVSQEAPLAKELKEKKYTKLKGEKQKAIFGVAELTKVTRQSEEKWQARSTGRYSYISQMPLSVCAEPGQKIRKQEVELMAKAGLFSNLQEIFSTKSGAYKNRIQVYEEIVKGEEVISGGISETVARIVFLLRGMGISPMFITESKKEINLEELESNPSEKVTAMKLKVANNEDILAWSYGEIKKPTTLDYRTLKEEQDGLFCQRIFGPTRDHECACGKYSRVKFKGVVCDKCGVEVTQSWVRRRRMGHVNFPVELVNPLFMPVIAEKLGIKESLVKELVFYDTWYVLDPQDTSYVKGMVIDAKEKEAEKNKLKVISGGEAIKHLLAEKKLDLPEAFLQNLPVIPTEFRPIFTIGGGRHATSDLIDLYRRIINWRNRLLRLMELNAEKDFITNEIKMVQVALYQLFDNKGFQFPVTAPNNRLFRSLNDELEFSLEELWERRVDYSGSAIVIPDSSVSKGQIEIPRQFLTILFRPFLMRALVEKEIASNLKLAKKYIEEGKDEIYEPLSEIISEKMVLASKTGAKPAIGVFQPTTTISNNSETIRIHPETAKTMGIDFSGEKINIHLPLSEEAQEEAKRIFTGKKTSKKNIPDSKLKNLTISELIDWAIQEKTENLAILDKLVLGIASI